MRLNSFGTALHQFIVFPYRPAKTHLRDRGRTTSDDFPGRDRTLSNFSEDGGPSRGRTESYDASPSRARTISGESPPRERLPSTDLGSKPTARRTSSRLLSVTGASDSALGAAGDRAATAQQGRNKQVSLSQQLDNIKIQGTESFIKAITPQREPIFPYGKRNWKQSTKYPQFDSVSPPPGAKGWEGVRKASILVSASRRLSVVGGLTFGTQQGVSDAQAGMGSTAQLQLPGRAQQPAPPTAPRPSSASTVGGGGGGGNPRTQRRSSGVGVAGQPGVTLSVPALSTPPRQPSKAPSSPPSPRPAEPVTPRPPESTLSPRRKGHDKGKSEVKGGRMLPPTFMYH